MRANLNRLTQLISIAPVLCYYTTGIFFIILPIIIDVYRYFNGLERLHMLPFKSE